MARLKEIEVGQAVVDWLDYRDWDVYQEVQFRHSSGVADIVAVKDGRLWIIECKTSASLRVMDQASGWRVDRRSIAVPYIRDWRDRGLVERVAYNFFEVGVLYVSGNYDIDEGRRAPEMVRYRKHSEELISRLRPEHKDFALAGSPAGSHATPYKITIRDVYKYLARNPGSSIQEIVADLGPLHYANEKSAIGNLRKALLNWESAWISVKYGRPIEFSINPESPPPYQ